eukprot:364403-Chlamydomonas_euryale.AAC.10
MCAWVWGAGAAEDVEDVASGNASVTVTATGERRCGCGTGTQVWMLVRTGSDVGLVRVWEGCKCGCWCGCGWGRRPTVDMEMY